MNGVFDRSIIDKRNFDADKIGRAISKYQKTSDLSVVGEHIAVINNSLTDVKKVIFKDKNKLNGF